jgi:hypothetical protein
MKKQALTAIEIDALAPSTLAAPDERREVSLNGGDYSSNPETRGRAALRWFIDTLALAGCGMAGVYVGVWLDEPNVSGDQTSRTRPRRVSAALRRLAMIQTDGRLIEFFPKIKRSTRNSGEDP